MEVVNNKTDNPIRIYQEKFRAIDPEMAAVRCGCSYSDGSFSLRLMNRGIKLSFPDMVATYEDGTRTADYIRILISRYVIEGTAAESSGKMLSFPEMPWGAVYEKAFRGRCIDRLARTYGHDLERFANAMESIGGKEARDESGRYCGGADCAYDIDLMPGLTIRALLWKADEEFPAAAQILFSDNFALAFTAEDMAVTGDVFLNAMRSRW